MYKKLLAILVLMLVFSVASPQTTQATQPTTAQDDGEIISHSNQGRKTLSWSASDIANAQPMPLRVKSGQVPPDSGNGISTLSSGAHRFSYPAKPGGVIQTISTANSSSVAYSPFVSTYPPLFTRHAENANVDIYPINTMGTLFFTVEGVPYRCSAVLVYRNVVWTAGHCVHDGGGSQVTGWSDDIVFYPAWKSGVNPLYGSYSNWVEVKVHSSWTNTGNLGYDFAAIRFDDTVNAAYPGDTIGYMGFQTGQSEAQSWKIYGYPSESPFSGNGLNACLTVFSRRDTSVNPATIGFGCDLPGGTSGAPLIRRFAYNGGWVNGTYSYYYNNKPKEVFSPYFGDSAWTIFCSAILSDINVTPIPDGC